MSIRIVSFGFLRAASCLALVAGALESVSSCTRTAASTGENNSSAAHESSDLHDNGSNSTNESSSSVSTTGAATSGHPPTATDDESQSSGELSGESSSEIDDSMGSSSESSGATTQGNETTSSGGDEVTSGEEVDPTDVARCNDAKLEWKTGSKTTFTSWPEDDSTECVDNNGCMYRGQFAACNNPKNPKSEDWVSKHNIVAVFPDLETLSLHDICIRSGDQTIVAVALDTCADSDCHGCCTQNQGDSDQLLDLEFYTDNRFDVNAGGNADVEWADLGPTVGVGCEL